MRHDSRVALLLDMVSISSAFYLSMVRNSFFPLRWENAPPAKIFVQEFDRCEMYEQRESTKNNLASSFIPRILDELSLRL